MFERKLFRIFWKLRLSRHKINTQKTDAIARRIGAITKLVTQIPMLQAHRQVRLRTCSEWMVVGLLKTQPTPDPKEDDDEPPPPPKPTPKPAPKTISGGVVNGKAISLPAPPYPAAAKAVGAKGSVSVQVLIDENGSVISASAASGHPLLRSGSGAGCAGVRNLDRLNFPDSRLRFPV